MFAPLPNTLNGYAPGVEKPTTTLAKMIALSLMHDQYTIKRGTSTSFEIEHAKFKIVGDDDPNWMHKTDSRGNRVPMRRTYFNIRPNPVEFDKDETSIIETGIQWALDHEKKKAEIDAEAKKQHKAVDVIEEWFKPCETPPASTVSETPSIS